MKREDVCFRDTELEVEDIEEFTLDAADVALAEDTRADSPVDVLQRRIVQVLNTNHMLVRCTNKELQPTATHLRSNNKSTEENTFASPFLECDVEMGLGALEIDKGREDNWHLNLCAFDHVVDAGSER